MTAAPAGRIARRLSAEDWGQRLALALVGLALLVAIMLPLYAVLSKSVEDRAGRFVGLANFAQYFTTPALSQSILNSVVVALIAAAITLLLAFGYAYALTRSAMPLKGLFRALALIPILAPSLLPAISLVYLFGNQGMIKGALMGWPIYGPVGIVMGEVFYAFPHALMILVAALATADARLYEAAQSLGTPRLRVFLTITLPGAKYGVISAFFVAFTLVITDFGVPKVIGGQYNVLATDVYKQVIGQQNFEMGAVVGMILLAPAVLAFAIDRLVQRRQVALLSARAVPLVPRPSLGVDLAMLAFCTLVATLLLAVLGVAGFASLVKLWPYNLAPSLGNYDFDAADSSGWASYWHSLQMAGLTAVAGTALVFFGAWLVERMRGVPWARLLVHLAAMVPLAVPGLVLGLAYIFFFNHPRNPLGFLYGTMAILVLSTVAHFYTVSHLTAVTALKQLDPEFEAVAASLKTSAFRMLWRVIVPVSLPAILDISIYFFVNAMTTVSAVVFLYTADTKLASIAVLNMDDAGKTANACAMGMLIVATSATVRGLQSLLAQRLGRTQAGRKR